jgi:hypothetical protein
MAELFGEEGKEQERSTVVKGKKDSAKSIKQRMMFFINVFVHNLITFRF